MTKQEEKTLLNQTIDNLPDGYLRDILTYEKPAIIRAIDNDLCFTDMLCKQDQLIHDISTNREELQRLHAELRTIKEHIKRANNEHNYLLSDTTRILSEIVDQHTNLTSVITTTRKYLEKNNT